MLAVTLLLFLCLAPFLPVLATDYYNTLAYNERKHPPFQTPYGYIDKTGRLYIDMRFEVALPFSQGLAAVRLNRKWGYIDHTGKFVVKPKFDFAAPFSSNGLAKVGIDASRIEPADQIADSCKIGFIDKTGKFVIPANFTNAQVDESSLEGMTIYGKLEPIKIGNTVYPKEKEWKFGFMGSSGDIIIKPQFSQCWGFSEGLAIVAQYADALANSAPKCGIIDKRGRLIVHPKFARVSEASVQSNTWMFHEGLCRMADPKSNKVGFVDRAGRFAIAPEFDEARDFSEGLAAVCKIDPTRPEREDKRRLWGYVNRAGLLAIPLQYERAQDFHDGLALVETHGGLLFINPRGSAAIRLNPSACFVGNFHDGLASVSLPGCRNYIDKTGKTVISLPSCGNVGLGDSSQNEWLHDFHEGLAVYSKMVAH